MMSKTLITLISSQTVTTEMGSESSGNWIRRKMSHSVAPSVRAASITSCEMPFSAAESTTMAKPADAQTLAKISA